MESQELIIHIDWSGPHSYEEVASFNESTAYGIYQIYGAHPVYGNSVLLYIGMAQKSVCGFADRFRSGSPHEDRFNKNPDSRRMQFYFGRLFGEPMPDHDTWEAHIKYAESLLIYSHKPAQNEKEVGEMQSKESVNNVRVFNWGQYRDLLPEVSGARWTKRFHDLVDKKNRPHFSTGRYPQPQLAMPVKP